MTHMLCALTLKFKRGKTTMAQVVARIIRRSETYTVDANGNIGHQTGVNQVGTRAAAFAVATATADRLTAEVSRLGTALDAFPRGPMGLTPDAVRTSPEYRAAKTAFDAANARSRNFNGIFIKEFAPELRDQRRIRRGSDR